MLATATPPQRPLRPRLRPSSAHLAACGAVLLSAIASLALYRLLLRVVPNLAAAEPTYAGEVFPGIELLEREVLRRPDQAAEVRYLVLLLGLFALYGLTLRAVAGRRSLLLEGLVVAAGAAFLLLQVRSPAMLSTDLYSYVMYGRVFAVYEADPYQTLQHYHADPYEPLSYWKTDPSFYGPLWTLLSAGLALLGGERIGLTVVLFRGLAIAAALGAGALVWAILRRVAPGRAAQGLVFFLWNPLVVLESGLSAHNDVVMVALLLLGVWLHLLGWRLAAVVALTLSALIKFATVFVAPLFLLLVLRRLPTWRARGRYLLLSGVAAALTIGVVLGLTRSGPAVLAVGALGSGTERYMNSLHALAFERLRLWLGDEPLAVRTPMDYQRSYAESIRATDLRSAAGRQLARLQPGTAVLILAPQAGDFVWVYEPVSGQDGYLRNRDVRKTGPPPVPDGSLVAQRAKGPAFDPIPRQANTILRLASWAAFGAFWLLALWRSRSERGCLAWSVAVLLAVYWLAGSWFWPWYVVWALALAALVPTSWPAYLTALLSASSLGLYASFRYQDIEPRWLFDYRALPVFLLPPIVLGLTYLGWRLRSSFGSRAGVPTEGRARRRVRSAV